MHIYIYIRVYVTDVRIVNLVNIFVAQLFQVLEFRKLHGNVKLKENFLEVSNSVKT